jgi:hypothetical protein
MKGDNAASDCCGIESLISLASYTGLPAPAGAQAKIARADYCYWAAPERCGTTTWTVKDVTTGSNDFRLDPAHIASYGAELGNEKCSWDGTSWSCLTV